MGLLDEAIREHLELKRRHGAEASEVAQQEHEALGPVRREDIAIPDTPAADAVEADLDGTGPPAPVAVQAPAVRSDPDPEPAEAANPAPADVASEGEAPASEPAADPVADAGLGQPTVAFSLADLEAAGAAEPPEEAAEGPAGARTVDEPTQAHPAPPAPDEPAPPEPEADAPAPKVSEPARTEDLAWDPPPPTPAPPPEVDGIVAAPAPDVDPGAVGHDELEETPEFLQETPEHDRLWFEQKPPRDFDF